jgi:hypothetical protein
LTQSLNPTSPQLTEANLRELSTARSAYRKIARAIRVAKFDGWTIAIFGVLSFLASLGDLPGMGIGMVLIVVAFIEIKSAKRLRDLDPASIRHLAFNQIAFGALLIIYALWQMYLVKTGRGILSDLDEAGLEGEDMDMARSWLNLFYCSLIAVAVFGMGGLAYYYFTRIKHLQKYLAQTPAWIVAMQKSGLTI